MHYVNAKKILNNKNGLNIYRGCSHGCIYCDSRSKCYKINHEFEDIEVKKNALILLAQELYKKNKYVVVGTGAMCDPYIPLEKEIKYTRGMLEILNDNHCGLHLLTKSDLVLRDLDLLNKINRHSKCIIAMTLTTYDDNLCKIIEPNVASTSKRIETLRILHDNGIETGVWLDPFLPFINDDEENFVNLLKACVNLKVKYIMFFGLGLTLREGNREYFYKKLDEHFPGLREKYVNTYGDSYEVTSKNHNKLNKIFIGICKKYNIMYDTDEIFNYISSYESHGTINRLFDIENL